MMPDTTEGNFLRWQGEMDALVKENSRRLDGIGSELSSLRGSLQAGFSQMQGERGRYLTNERYDSRHDLLADRVSKIENTQGVLTRETSAIDALTDRMSKVENIQSGLVGKMAGLAAICSIISSGLTGVIVSQLT